MGNSKFIAIISRALFLKVVAVLVVLAFALRLFVFLKAGENVGQLAVLDFVLSVAAAMATLFLILHLSRAHQQAIYDAPPEIHDEIVRDMSSRSIQMLQHSAMLLTIPDDGPIRIISCNKQFERLTGIPVDRVINREFKSLFTAQSQEKLDTLPYRESQSQVEVELLSVSRELIPVTVRNVPMPTKREHFGIVVLRDRREQLIQKARQVDYTTRLESMVNERTEALLQTERLRMSLMESMDSIVISLDEEGLITYVNPAWQQYLGFARNESHGQPASVYMHEEDGERFERLYRQSLAEKINMSRLEFRARHADGSWRTLAGTLSLIKDLGENVQGSVLAMSDVTEQRRMEEWITHSERMESIGQLASGLAHDFNNLFQEMMGLTRRIRREGKSNEIVTRDAQSIETIVKRATGFVRQLLSFAASGEKNISRVDINDAVNRVHEMIGRSLPKRIQLDFDLQSRQHVDGDPTQFDQVFLNLIFNARDAIEGEGLIQIKTYDILADEGAPTPINSPGHGRYVVVEVRDNGSGMPNDVRQRIFDPFFSTKTDGRGTGLGLSTVYGIIRSHGGVISVESEPGDGTLFTILLPAKMPTGEMQSFEGNMEGMPEITVLLVDDDRDIAELTAEAFQMEGFKVLTAHTGKEAVDTFQAFSRQIDIVVMDKRMPEMDGLTAARRMRQIEADCRIIISSGQDIGRDMLFKSGPTRFLQKPYQFDELLDTVCQLLGRSITDIPPEGS